MTAYLLHGVADQTSEHIAGLFLYPGDVVEFVRGLPGTYRLATLTGADFATATIAYDLPI